jgi:DNA-directed RNA polymerase specialized sigma24 family protein
VAYHAAPTRTERRAQLVRLWAMAKHLIAPAERDGGGLRGPVPPSPARSPTTTTTATTSSEAGPSPSFEAFYRDHADEVRRALCLALGDADLGTEAADEAMTRTCARWAEVGGYGNPRGWAYRVGLNWARSRQRRNRWRDRRPLPDRGVLAVPGDPELAAALHRLTLDHRAVVVCRFYLDWSVEETAAALGIPAGTVKSRLARALSSLQRTLEDPR